MIVLKIKPLGQGRFAAFVCGHPVIRSSRTPFVDAARALIVAGKNPGARFVMVGPEGTPKLTSTLGAAAALRIEEGSKPPRFRAWKPNPLAEAAE